MGFYREGVWLLLAVGCVLGDSDVAVREEQRNSAAQSEPLNVVSVQGE